ncbi:hypothetical protein E2C01_036275 [Portunus trituberculatus]|uniref:Uncharacterized protein n=1 Tax=Portunus trituberculatus TaxID=210409 RepID=A0A5B7FC10_PORTR|nr:hypothetical protein [Portunus trituberculatus]
MSILNTGRLNCTAVVGSSVRDPSTIHQLQLHYNCPGSQPGSQWAARVCHRTVHSQDVQETVPPFPPRLHRLAKNQSAENYVVLNFVSHRVTTAGQYVLSPLSLESGTKNHAGAKLGGGSAHCPGQCGISRNLANGIKNQQNSIAHLDGSPRAGLRELAGKNGISVLKFPSYSSYSYQLLELLGASEWMVLIF